jgi:hypothetical protein
MNVKRLHLALMLGIVAVMLSAVPAASQVKPSEGHTQDLRRVAGAFDHAWVAKARPLYDTKREVRPEPAATIGVVVVLFMILGLLVCAGRKAKVWRHPSTLVNLDRLEFRMWLRVVTRWGLHW